MHGHKSIIYILTLNTFLFSCGNEKKEMPIHENSSSSDGKVYVSNKLFESSGMKLGTLSEQRLSTSISTRGFIDVPPGNKASVSPYHGGYVNDIDLLPGQTVKKGQILFTLQNPDLIEMQQEYMETKEQLAYLQADFERQKILSDENISSKKNFLKAESDYKVMLAKHTGMREILKLINISVSRLDAGHITTTIPVYAPIGGFITKVDAIKGAFIHASDEAVQITNTDHIHLELQVFERDALQVSEDQDISFKVPESGNDTFHGTVHLVGKSVDGETRTINVHGHIAEEDEKRFIPGMFVEAEIELESQLVACLPESAIVNSEGTDMVLVRINNNDSSGDITFEPQEVRLGKKLGMWVEILNKDEFVDKEILLLGAFNLMRS